MRAYFDKLLTPNPQQKTVTFNLSTFNCLIFRGCVFSFALAPYHYWWLAILSPALLYATLRSRSAKQAFGIGWAMVLAYGSWGFWLYTSIHVYGDTNSALSVGMIGIMALVMGLFTVFKALFTAVFP